MSPATSFRRCSSDSGCGGAQKVCGFAASLSRLVHTFARHVRLHRAREQAILTALARCRKRSLTVAARKLPMRALASRAREQAILTALATCRQRSLTVAARKLPMRALASRAREQAILTALAACQQRSLTVAARKLPMRALAPRA